LNKPIESKLTETAETVLKRRYYLDGEDWEALCQRVAGAVASVESGVKNKSHYEEQFFDIIYDLDFLPNSPCLMNAGTEIGALSACYVIPVEDTLAGIFDAVKWGALVNKTGGGTGYSFSRLRGKDSSVCSTNGVASGPISFATVFDKATDVIKQGGRRRGANMGVLACTHPDVIEFINCKRDKGKLTNFNLSVALTDEFMEAVSVGGEYDLIAPTTGNVVNTLKAGSVFDQIIDAAWDNGEPGVLFIDAANRANPTPWLGKYESTNPCGEVWLLPFEACNLGSINLGRFVVTSRDDYNAKVVDWGRLKDVVMLAVRFLDNVVDASKFPLPEITEATRKTRKLGLGIMGLHDMLIRLEIPYASEEGRIEAARVMRFIRDIAEEESTNLAKEKGICPAFDGDEKGPFQFIRRNAALTSIQPTGTVSMIANCSSGCEPHFSLASMKHVMDDDHLVIAVPLFEEVARCEGFYSQDVMKRVAKRGSVVGINEIPKKWQEIFRCAQDISVGDHIKMQAALQNNGVDASISKTINMPSTATKEDVKKAYLEGWALGCKGLTVYRDGCREGQVLTAGAAKEKTQLEKYEEVVNKCIQNSSHKMILPDVLRSRRYKLKDKDGESIYVIVCFTDDMQPVEVFAKFPYDNRIEQQERSTMWSTTCRLVSMSLRYGVPVDEVIKQLDRSSGSMFDLPAQLSKLFKGFLGETGQEAQISKEPCPDCADGFLRYEEGCMVCKSCGWSKCS